MTNPWITTMEEESIHQRSLLQMITRIPCNSETKNNAVQEDKLNCRLEAQVGLVPRSRSEAQQLIHSSRRLKDTLTEKRH